MSYKKWTPEEDAVILSRETTVKDMAEMFGRTEQSVYWRIKKLNASRLELRSKDGKICNETCPDYCPYKDCKLAVRHIKDNATEYIDRADRGRIYGKQSAKVMLAGNVRRMFGV
jgi:hypothetical protein